jgi:hypothetical protein
MPTAEAHIPTDRAVRYLQQLTSHAARMSHGDGLRHSLRHGLRHGRSGTAPTAGTTAEVTSDTTGRITLGTAVCELTAGPTALTLHATAVDEEQLRALQEAVTRTVERIGRRDGLTVGWG